LVLGTQILQRGQTGSSWMDRTVEKGRISGWYSEEEKQEVNDWLI